MEDPVYFSHLGVSISDSRLIVNGNVISFKSITAIEPKVLKPPLGFARVYMFGGLAFLFGSGSWPLLGLCLMVLGVVLWYLAKPKYSIVIHTPNGEHQAVLSEDALDIENIFTALDIAVALRGLPQ